MKQNVMLTIASLLSILLLTLHITDDIVRGISKAEPRSEEHTSELQSQSNLVCRLLLEKKNIDDAGYTLGRTVPHDVIQLGDECGDPDRRLGRPHHRHWNPDSYHALHACDGHADGYRLQ